MAVVASSDDGPPCLVNMWGVFRARETPESLVGWSVGWLQECESLIVVM